MPPSKYLRWLKEDRLTTKVARRFASFCEEDIEQRVKSETFDADIYEAAVRLVLDKLEDKEDENNSKEKEQDNAVRNAKNMRKRG